VLDKEVQAAKDLLQAGNKQRALLALKKKKYQEQLLLKTDQQLLQLEQLTQAIEFALVEQQVLKGLETGNQVLKSIHQELSLDNVEKLMMDTQDAIEYQREIDEALSGSLSLEDQEAIEAELDALVAIEVLIYLFF
jgi:charged multivesicular body protein 6